VTGSAWFHLATAFVLTGLVLSFVAKPYWVPSGSMEQTLLPGDRILVNRMAFTGGDPAAGDIVVFDAGLQWDAAPAVDENPLKSALRWIGEVTGFGPSGPYTLVKRVIADPGQSAECCSADGQVMVDSEPLDEPYVWNDLAFMPGELDCATVPRSPRCFDRVVVPPDSYLVLGDNRGGSSDSATRCRGEGAGDDCWRWATRSGIIGKALVVWWPIQRWSGL
jgi:signal peptidase I